MHRELSKKLFDEQTAFCSDHRLLKSRQWNVICREYPLLIIEFSNNSKKSIRVKMICDDWDDLPASIEILGSEGNILSQTDFPKGQGMFNSSPHPRTQKPFICSPGSLEYHQHSSHINDRWENYKTKAGYDLGGILTRIWNGWKLTK